MTTAFAPAGDMDRWLLSQADAALLLLDAASGQVLHSNPALAAWLGEPLPSGPLWAWSVWDTPSANTDTTAAQRLRTLVSLAALGLPLQGLALPARQADGQLLSLRLWLKPVSTTGPRRLLCTLVREAEGPTLATEAAGMPDLLATLTALLERHDPASVGHQRRVADLAGTVARRLQWPAPEVRAVVLAALLHDLGMVTVPAEVLGQRGWLEPEQLQRIQQHVVAGVHMLSHIDFEGPVAQLMAQHHERLDGSGYPAGLSGSALLRGAQVIGMADMLDAMTRERPYQKAQSLDDALETLAESAGVLFEAGLVQACLDLFTQDGYRFPEA